MKNRSTVIYEFGPYRLDLANCRLSRAGQEITLRPKLLDLLAVLVERRGQMLDKEDLLNTVWADAAVEESNLVVSINALRRVLGDENYIETVTRRGYRFTAPVRVVSDTVGLPAPAASAAPLPPGGAVPLHSQFYVTRPTDAEFQAAIERRDGIVLVKGARQVGKTSLLARGLQQAREAGAAVVLTDFQHFTAGAFESVEKLLLTLAELIADQLELATLPHDRWNSFLSASSNFERYLRRTVLAEVPQSLVWCLDEADRLFNYPYASEVFGLFRSWHNLRALDPAGPWQRLTLALAYATEAHLFITDLNQSPFNVGTRLALSDFTLAQTGELNQRYQAPLAAPEEIARFYQLLGGHPYLTQRGLYELHRGALDFMTLLATADREDGIFGDHLRRLLLSLERDPALCAALCGVLRGEADLSTTHFYRLRSAGLLNGGTPAEAQVRCELYTQYLTKRLL